MYFFFSIFHSLVGTQNRLIEGKSLFLQSYIVYGSYVGPIYRLLSVLPDNPDILGTITANIKFIKLNQTSLTVHR